MSPAKPKRPLTGPAAWGLVFGLSLVAGIVGGVGRTLVSDIPGTNGLAASLAINGLVMAFAIVLCVWWWRRIDEAAREAHKWAWWWGGSTGMAVGGAILLTALGREGDLGLGGMQLNDILASGMILMLCCQVIGYTVAWVVWWAKRR